MITDEPMPTRHHPVAESHNGTGLRRKEYVVNYFLQLPVIGTIYIKT